MFRSIRWRLVLSYMLIALLAVSVVGLVTHRLVRDSLAQMEQRSLTDNAQAVAQQAYTLMRPRVETAELNQLVQTAAFLGDVHVQVINNQGRIIADSAEPGDDGRLVLMMPGAVRDMWEMRGMSMRGPAIIEIDPKAFDLPEGLLRTIPPGTSVTVIRRDMGLWGGRLHFGEVVADESGTAATDLPRDLAPRSDTTVTARIGDKAEPVGYVKLSEPPALHRALLQQLRQALMIAGGGAVVVAGLLGVWSSQRMAAPIRSLARTAAQMGAGDLSVRAEVAGRNRHAREITELAGQFNQMADNLQTSFDQLAAERDALRRFIADASHELRTPITALKNFNGLLIEGAADDPIVRHEFLVESQAQIDRLAWITAHLLDLSRRDAGLVPLELAECDLDEVIDSAIAPFTSRATEQGVDIVADLPGEDINLTCDRTQLEMALGNLLDNALKATSPGDIVTVSAEEAGDQVRITVEDTGIGISPDDLPRVFDRFHRGRYRDTVRQGIGIGLAIVKSIVEAHGGAVTLDSIPGEGTRVSLSLPKTQAPTLR